MSRKHKRFSDYYDRAAEFVAARRALAPYGFDPVASRQYFSDTITGPLNTAYTTITATTETVLIPTVLTPINAMEPRAEKVYELIVGGTVTTGASGTLIIQPRIGTVIGGASLGVSPTQAVVPSVTTAQFILRCWLAVRSIGLPGANSTVVCSGDWHSNGAVATAASETAVTFGTTGAAISFDASIAQALWIGVTFSVAPSVIPQWHLWKSIT